MRTLKTRNGNVLVAGGKTNGVARWGYFTPDAKFIRYASFSEWNEALRNWSVPMEKVTEEKFIFPSLNSWKLQGLKKTNAGNLCFFWRWRRGAKRWVQQTSIMLNGEKVYERDDRDIDFKYNADYIIEMIDIVNRWNNDGFSLFNFTDAVYYVVESSLSMPLRLIHNCAKSFYNEKTVKAAVDFIGVEIPDKYNIEYVPLKKRNTNPRTMDLVKISCSSSAGKCAYTIFLDGEDKLANLNGTMEEDVCSGGDIYKSLLWVFLNPLKEKLLKK